MRVYYINMDRHPARRRRMEHRLGEIAVSAARITAIDGNDLDERTVQDFRRREDPRYPMLRGEIGCTMSHVVAWERIAGDTAPFAVVLEDDIHFGPRLAAFVGDDGWVPADADIVKIETNLNRVDVARRPVRELHGRRLVRLYSKHARCGGYVVSRACAARLADLSGRSGLPVDQLIFNPEFSPFATMCIYQLDPALVIQDEILPGGPVGGELASSIARQRRVETPHLQTAAAESLLARRLAKPVAKAVATARRLPRQWFGAVVSRRVPYRE